MSDLISVVISTYNREDALQAVLKALAGQSDRHFEIVVADDGSGPRTADLVRAFAATAPVPVRHVWHEDRGFRLADIRNLAIQASAGAYVVFLDGDCIARPHFVAAHRALAEPGWFVTGTRVLMSAPLTARVLRERLAPQSWSMGAWLACRARRDINRVTPLIALPLGALRKLRARQWRGARGSNMAFWRTDLHKVDGFDASFEGWGREDSDLFIRLLRAGVRRKEGRNAAAVLHLWHPEADRSGLAENERQLRAVLAGSRVAARRGLSAACP